jgi:hypothetical protein
MFMTCSCAGKKHSVKPSYFSTALSHTAAAVSKRAQYSQQQHEGGSSGDREAEQGHVGNRSSTHDRDNSVHLRLWTIGEIVSEAVAAGLIVTELLEEQGPRAVDAGIPKTFTLVCGVPEQVS